MAIQLFSGPLGTRIIDMAAAKGVTITPARAMELCLEHGQAVEQAVTQYAEAGADIILAPTLGATTHPGIVNRRAVELCRRCAPGLPVAAMVAMTDKPDHIADQCLALADAGCDMIMLETVTNHDTAHRLMEIALEANIRRGTDMPVHISFYPAPGLDLRITAASMMQYRPASIGINCFRPLAEACRLLSLLPQHTLSMRPALADAGGSPDSPDKMVSELRKPLSDPRLKYAGTCCGAHPEHTKYLKNLISND